eukprot:jgi/Orpsp1_1/1180395/evm.model.c7180000073227.1
MLEKAFTKSPEQRRLDLRDKINNLKYDINEDIHIFISTLQNYIDDLENIEGDLPDNTKVGILNRSLPENLRWINLFQFKDNWLKCTEYAKTVIPEIIFSNTKEIQKQRNIQLLNVVSTKGTHQNYHTNNKSISINSNSNRNNSRKNGRCRLCKKFGHYIAECWYNNKNRSNTKHNQHKSKNHPKHKNKPNKSVQNYRKINNSIYAINKTQEKDETIFPDSFINLQINSIENQPEEKNFISKSSKKLSCWILDSGASIHTTNDKNLLINIRKCSEQISLPNGKIIKSTLIGNFIGSINGYKISLLDVHYTPDIKRNLISISSLIKNRYKVVFSYFNNQPYSIIYNEIGKRILTMPANESNTYKIWINQYLPLPSTTPNIAHIYTNNNLYLWHRRFCHFNIDKIKNKLSKISQNNKCQICSNSKQKNKPYKRSQNYSKSVFELIHLDLIGPIEESIYGNKFILTILDDFSRYGWTLFLKDKSETFNSFHLWYLKFKNILNKKLKHIRSDNGTEFSNHHFENFCSLNGIDQQFTIPYNPQSNGKSERFNGTLISSTKAILNDSKLDYKFWEYAVNTANYVYNRLPHSGINNSIPYEILFHSSVNYNNLKVFGCKVFYYVPKSFRNKFDNNSLPGIFLGYSEYGYKILDITYNKIVYSRSVDFFENDLVFSTNFTPQNLLPIYKIEGDINNSSVISTNKISLNKLDNNNTIEYIPNTTKRNMPYKTYQITKRVKIYIPTLREPVNYNDIFNLEDKDYGLKLLQSEPCVYVKRSKEGKILCILAIYVDDILIAGNEPQIEITKRQIKRKFNIKEIGDVDFVIGIKFEKYENGYFLHQERYINDILNKYNIDNNKKVRTLKPLENEKLRKRKFDETVYRSAVGSLLYLAICTRPDILFSVSKAARRSSDPNYEDWEGILKIFKYLKDTINYGILFTRNTNIDIYTDADYAGDEITRKSTSGFLFTIGGAPTSWLSKLQHCVSTSTAESEYYSLSECAKHCVWYISFLNELNINVNYLTINIDNKAAIYNSKNQTINPKNKHIDVRYHYIRELVSNGKIKLNYIKSKNNLADGLTKYLNGPAMNEFR